MLSADFSQGPPVPPGQHRLTVTNPEGQSTTWEGVVTVMPAPEITSVTPDWIALGDSVDLVFYGRNFREGTHVRLSEERIGEATWVSSERLKIRLKTNPRLAGKACDVFFKLRDGPEVKVGTSLVRVSSSCLVFMVATVLLDEASANVVREFRDSLEWKLRRPLGQLRIPGRTRNYNISPPPVFEVLLPAQITVERGELISSAWARPFHQGSRIWFHINGQELSGLVLSEPFAVFSEDYFENKRMQ